MKWLVEAHHCVGLANELGFRKEQAGCGNSYNWIISDLKTLKGARNRIKDHKWPKDTTMLIVHQFGPSIHDQPIQSTIICNYERMS